MEQSLYFLSEIPRLPLALNILKLIFPTLSGGLLALYGRWLALRSPVSAFWHESDRRRWRLSFHYETAPQPSGVLAAIFGGTSSPDEAIHRPMIGCFCSSYCRRHWYHGGSLLETTLPIIIATFFWQAQLESIFRYFRLGKYVEHILLSCGIGVYVSWNRM